METHRTDFSKKWAKIIAKAWSDPAFKKKLLEHPETVLAAEGLSAPKGIKIEIHENTKKVVHLNLPLKTDDILSENELLRIAAAAGCDCACNGTTDYC